MPYDLNGNVLAIRKYIWQAYICMRFKSNFNSFFKMEKMRILS